MRIPNNTFTKSGPRQGYSISLLQKARLEHVPGSNSGIETPGYSQGPRRSAEQSDVRGALRRADGESPCMTQQEVLASLPLLVIARVSSLFSRLFLVHWQHRLDRMTVENASERYQDFDLLNLFVEMFGPRLGAESSGVFL